MKQVDKHFRDHLSQHESEVPADMWSRIAPAIEEKTRRGLPFLWLISGLALVLVGGMTYYMSMTGHGAGTTSANEATNTTAVGIASTGNTEPSVGSTTIAHSAHSTTAATTLTDSDAEGYSSADQTKITDGAAASATSSNTATKIATDVERKANAINYSASAGLSSPTPAVDQGTTMDNTAFKLKITKSYYDGTDNITGRRSTVTVAGEEARTYETKLTAIALPSAQEEGTVLADLELLPKLSLFGAGAPKCPSFLNKDRVGFFVDAYISHDLAMKHSSAANSSYLADREATETGQYSYGAGLRFSYFLGKGFGVKSGIHYNQLRERFHFDDPDGKETKTIEKIETVTDAEGNTTVVTTVEVIEVPGRRTVTHGNKYHFLDVPVLLFYEFGKRKSPFYYSINAGTNINLLFRQSGKYLAADGEVVSFAGDDEYPSQYNSRVGLSLYASVGIHYVLSESMDLTIEPHYSTQLTAATMARSDVSQRFSNMGINTGIRYKF